MASPSDTALGGGANSRTWLVVSMVVFIDLLGFGLVIPLLPHLVDHLGATPAQITWLFAVYSAFQFVAAPVLGRLSDHYGRRKLLALSQLGSAVGYMLMAWALGATHILSPGTALILVYASRVIDGISGGNISLAQAIIADVTPPGGRAKAMGILGASFGLAFAIGPAIGGLLAHHPWLPATVAAAVSLVAAILSWALLPAGVIGKPSHLGVPATSLSLLRLPKMEGLIVIALLSTTAFFMSDSTTVLYLKDILNYHERQTGAFFFMLGMTIVVVQGGLVGILTRRFGELAVAVVGLITVGAGMMLFVLAASLRLQWLVIGGGLLNAVGRSLQQPALLAMVSHATPPRDQGLAMGLYSSTMSLGRVLGPLSGGPLYAVAIALPYRVNAALTMVAATVALWMGKLRAKPAAR